MAQPLVVMSINSAWNVLNFRLGLVRGLQEAGWRVVAIVPDEPAAARLGAHGIEHIAVPMSARGTSPLADIRLLWTYWRVLGRLRPGAYLGYTIKPNIWGTIAARLRGVPVVANVAGLGETFIGTGPVNRLVRLLYRLALKQADRVFFQNPDDRDRFVTAGIVRPDAVALLPGSGVDLARFAPPERDPPVRGGAFRFLLVTRLLKAKGVADYVAAARLLRDRFPAARWQVLGLAQTGRGAIDPETLARWSRETALEITPGAEDVRPHLQAADCVVLPTFYPEGTPRSLLEAAASGRPLIATRVPGCSEIVRDGKNGYLVPPRDPDALAAAMARMLEAGGDDLARMGAASRALAECEFDERIVIERYLAALAAVTRVQATR